MTPHDADREPRTEDGKGDDFDARWKALDATLPEGLRLFEVYIGSRERGGFAATVWNEPEDRPAQYGEGPTALAAIEAAVHSPTKVYPAPPTEADTTAMSVAATPAAPEPGLRAAAQDILDLIDTSVAEGDDSMPLYDVLDPDTWHPAIDALRAALESPR